MSVSLCLLGRHLTPWLWVLFSIYNLALQWKTPHCRCFNGVDKHFLLCRTGVGCRYIEKNIGVEQVKISIIMFGMNKECLFLGRRFWLLVWTYKYFSCVLCVFMTWAQVICVMGFRYEEYFFFSVFFQFWSVLNRILLHWLFLAVQQIKYISHHIS